MFRVFVTNLGKYNEGELVGEWLELPATQNEIDKCLERIGISDEPDENGTYYEEYFINDYEMDVDGLRIGEYDSLDELNDLAEAIEDNEEAAEALIYFGYRDADQIRENIDNVIYVTKPEGCESEEYAVGYYYAVECGCVNIPDEIIGYFDFESYGRDIMINGSFYTASDGTIYELIA